MCASVCVCITNRKGLRNDLLTILSGYSSYTNYTHIYTYMYVVLAVFICTYVRVYFLVMYT